MVFVLACAVMLFLSTYCVSICGLLDTIANYFHLTRYCSSSSGSGSGSSSSSSSSSNRSSNNSSSNSSSSSSNSSSSCSSSSPVVALLGNGSGAAYKGAPGPRSLRVAVLVFYRSLDWPATSGLSSRFKPNSIWSHSLASLR